MFYVLNGHTPVPTDDVHAWAAMFASDDRMVACDTWQGVTVSTVFIGLPGPFDDEPLLFETCQFDDYGSDVVARYATWEAAMRGHRRVLAKLKRVRRNA